MNSIIYKNIVLSKKQKTVIIFLVLVIQLVLLLPSLCTAQSDQTVPYLIGPEDILEISVWKDKDLTKTVVVRPDGKISFPLIGDVVAGGKTVEWLEENIKKRINEYVPDAVVSVMLLQVNGFKIYVVGKVERSGGTSFGRRINVMQAIAMAGGLTKFANESDIIILRTISGKQTKIKFDYGQVKRGIKIEQNIWLQNGDVIVVP